MEVWLNYDAPTRYWKRRKVTCGFHLVEGKQGHAMDDYHVAQFEEVDSYEVGLFAYLTLIQVTMLQATCAAIYLPDFWTETEEAIKKAYQRTDGKILKRKENDDRRKGGSTAVTVILINGNVASVDGQLFMLKAFGDRPLKRHVSSDLDVVIEITDEEVVFIILASDSLWKVMSNQEAMDSIRQVRDSQEAAMELIEEALDRGSKDDISCIAVHLH